MQIDELTEIIDRSSFIKYLASVNHKDVWINVLQNLVKRTLCPTLI